MIKMRAAERAGTGKRGSAAECVGSAKGISPAVRRIICAAAICTICLSGQKVSAQVVDTTDIMKEFDENSFRNAAPVRRVKDSSKLYQHLVGFKIGYALDNASFSQSFEHKSLTSYKNFGVYYIYYHSLWNSIPLFGIQTGLQYNEEGYTSVKYNEPDTVKNRKGINGKERLQCIEIPFVSQFRVDFWKMRILANVGAFGSYVKSASFSSNVPDSVSNTYRKFGYGFIVGGGIALIFNPIEIHFEVNYKYTLSNLYSPKAYYKDTWVYVHTSQLILSAGLFYRVGRPYGSRPPQSGKIVKSKKKSDIEFVKTSK